MLLNEDLVIPEWAKKDDNLKERLSEKKKFQRINPERLVPIPTQLMDMKIKSTRLHKTLDSSRKLQSKSSLASDVVKMNGTQNNEYQTLVEGSSLINALAFEFETKGVERDPREITGLNSRQSGKRNKTNRKASTTDMDKGEEDFTGSLSSITKMKVQPGVMVKEYQNTKSKTQLDDDRENRPSIVRSGGDYISNVALNGKGKAGKNIYEDGARKMSLKEYRKTRGIRSYEMGKQLEDDKRKGSAPKAPIRLDIQSMESAITVKDSNNPISKSIEAELADASFENSVACKTSTHFSIGKTHRESIEVGKITLNPDLVATNTGRGLRTSLDKNNYLKNLLYKKDQGDVNGSLDFSRNSNIKIVDNLGATLTSLNPRAHSYARCIDFIKPKRLNNMKLQQSFDYDSARHSSYDNSSYAQYMNAHIATNQKKSKRGQSSTGMGSTGVQWTAVTTRAQTSTG